MKDRHFELKKYCIIGPIDRPCTKLIAEKLFEQPEHNRAVFRYITQGTSGYLLQRELDDVTYVEDFGVTLVFEQGTVRAFDSGAPSKAKYPDGSMRLWQDATQEFNVWGTWPELQEKDPGLLSAVAILNDTVAEAAHGVSQ